MQHGRIIINGDQIIIVHGSNSPMGAGTEENFISLRARAYGNVPQALQGEMARIESSSRTGNARISFDGSYFPSKSNMSDQDYQLVADKARAQKVVICGAIVCELIKAGVPLDHFTVRDSFFDPNTDANGQVIRINGVAQGQFKPTMQLWLNKSRTSERSNTNSPTLQGPTMQTLSVEFVSLYDDAVEGARALKSLKTEFGDDEATLMAILANKIAKAQVVQAAAKPATHVEDETPDDDEMPQE